MDNLDDSEKNAKISDSAYSNSCSNSQSRRSHSSKSTHSGSNSSGSSGYGGKQSTSGSANQPQKKEKESKKKKPQEAVIAEVQVVLPLELSPPEPVGDKKIEKEEIIHDVATTSPVDTQAEKGAESMDISTSEGVTSNDKVVSLNIPTTASLEIGVTCSPLQYTSEGFSCAISMRDGVVMYTTSSLTKSLGFPKDMWIGRSFIDFVHPRDRDTFASQITSGLAVPKILNRASEKASSSGTINSTIVCRIRRYRGFTSGFAVKDRFVTFMPFLLKFSFKDINEEDGNVMYLVIQATPFYSAFKEPNQVLENAPPFVMRHAPNGIIEYIDPDSVPYLGYLPQDVTDKDVLHLYHHEDLSYLNHVYEIIVKEGGMPRSKPYRMMAQNGEFVKLETEWSSFINPWSKKLEFVIGKHHIVTGPANPDVFRSPDPEKMPTLTDEEKSKAQAMRDNIIKIMNEVLTKPAETAKQRMSKRFQDVAIFMESLMEEPPKIDDENRTDIQDPDLNYCERESVMLGGISPHHEYNDSKSSTETPLSYTQLNYNETLQRYFQSHTACAYEDYNTVTGENILGVKNLPSCNSNLSSNPPILGECCEPGSSDSSGLVPDSKDAVGLLLDYRHLRLTESLINKHNVEMEKELMKCHREKRSTGKGEKISKGSKKKKKKEHLARCNASYQTKPDTVNPTTELQPHGVKRALKHMDSDNIAHKQHCSSSRQARRKQITSGTPAHTSSVSATVGATTGPGSTMNTYILGVGIPQQVPMMGSGATVSGMFPMYYTTPPPPTFPVSTETRTQDVSISNQQYQPTAGVFPMYYTTPPSPTIPASTEGRGQDGSTNNQQYQPTSMQYMMYGHSTYGSPFIYPQIAYPMIAQQTMLAPSMQQTNNVAPLGLTNRNYEQACKQSLPIRPGKSDIVWRNKSRRHNQISATKTEQVNGDSDLSINALDRESGAQDSQSGNQKAVCSTDNKPSTNNLSLQTAEAAPQSSDSRSEKTKSSSRVGNSEETHDRTDGESSYSSFYSSFFKTESGSAEESGDLKKNLARTKVNIDETHNYFDPQQRKIARRKMDPPWMEQVCVSSELIYKYQVLTKPLDEVLTADKEKISNFDQPSLVNEQLGQLYLDLQLEGVAARLTLEEGITSSSSSGEESTVNKAKVLRRKREYNRLVMIYEEDAPLPPAEEEDEISCRSPVSA